MAVNRNFMKGQHVLVRDFVNAVWVTSIFDSYDNNDSEFPYKMESGNSWKCCLHRNSDTESLIGTSKIWDNEVGIIDFDFSFNDPVLVRDHDGQLWRLRHFDHQSSDWSYPYYTDSETSWKQCIPYIDKYKHILNTVMNPESTFDEYCAMFTVDLPVLVRDRPFEAWKANRFEHIVMGSTIDNMQFVTTDGKVWENCIPLNLEYNNGTYLGIIQEIVEQGFTISSSDIVLVRDQEDDDWVLRVFMGKRPSVDSMQYLVDNDVWWEYCLPYNVQTKYLLGTNENYDKLVYTTTEGLTGYSDEHMTFLSNDEVLCRDNFDRTWKKCIFQKYVNNAVYPYITDCNNYVYCIPYCEDTKHLLGTTDPYVSNPHRIRQYDIVCYSNDFTEWYVGQFVTFDKDANARYIIIDNDGDKMHVKYVKPYYHSIDHEQMVNKSTVFIDPTTGFIFVQGQKILVRDHDVHKWEGPKYFTEYESESRRPYSTNLSNWKFAIPFNTDTVDCVRRIIDVSALYPINKIKTISEPIDNPIDPGILQPTFHKGELILVTNDPDANMFILRVFEEYGTTVHPYVTHTGEKYKYARPYGLLTKHKTINSTDIIHDSQTNMDYMYSQPVLVRDTPSDKWIKVQLVKIDQEYNFPYYTIPINENSNYQPDVWMELIPFNEMTQHLTGTNKSWNPGVSPANDTPDPTLIYTVPVCDIAHGDEVLVRNSIDELWAFSKFNKQSKDLINKYQDMEGNDWKYCLPYNGNEFLTGTFSIISTNKLDDIGEELVIGDPILVRDSDGTAWFEAVYKCKVFRNDCLKYMSNTACWKQCVKLTPDTCHLSGAAGKLEMPKKIDYNYGDSYNYHPGDKVIVRNDNCNWIESVFQRKQKHADFPYIDKNARSWKMCLPYDTFSFLIDSNWLVLNDNTDNNQSPIINGEEIIVDNGNKSSECIAIYICKIKMTDGIFYATTNGYLWNRGVKWARANNSTPSPKPIPEYRHDGTLQEYNQPNDYCCSQHIEYLLNNHWFKGEYVGPAPSSRLGVVIQTNNGRIIVHIDSIRPIG